MSDEFKELLEELYPIFVGMIICFLILFLIAGKYTNHGSKEVLNNENTRYQMSARVLPSNY